MTHRRGAVWTERVFLALILASLAGTLNLVMTMHRRVASADLPPDVPRSTPSTSVASTPSATEVASSSPSLADKAKPTPTTPAVPVQDPTTKVLAGMTLAIGAEIGAADEADQRTAKLETSRKAAVAESERWKRRELLVRQQIARLSQKAAKLEQETSEFDAERDVLARERDALKAALTKAGRQPENSILPYKGPNGTWRRPIVIECVGNVAKLLPQGPTFSMLDLSSLINPRSSPVVLAIAREMLRIDRAGTPDGAPVVPYLVFMVRPNGIRPYYEVRARLEPLGIAFGYELVEQDLAVDIPDYDDLTTWDGTKPLDVPAIASATAKPRVGWPSTSASDSPGSGLAQGSAVMPPEGPGAPGAWPSSRDGGGTAGFGGRSFAQGGLPGSGPEGAGSAIGQMPGGRPTGELALRGNPGRGIGPDGPGGPGSDNGSPDDFVWPSNARNGGSRGNSGTNPDRSGSASDPGMGDGSGSVPGGSGSRPSAGYGPYGQGSADGPSSGGSFSSRPPGGTGFGTGLAGGAFGQAGGTNGFSTGPITGGQGGLGSGTGSLPFSGGGTGSSPAGLGGSSGVAAGSGSEPDPGSGPGRAGTGFGPGGPDVLPDLEPAQDGTQPAPPATGGPKSGSTSSNGNLGTGSAIVAMTGGAGSAGGTSGLGANSGGTGPNGASGGTSGLGANAAGGGGQTTPGGPSTSAIDPGTGGQLQGNGTGRQGSGGQAPPSGPGATPSDPGFTAYPSGLSAPGGTGNAQGTSGTSPPAGSGSLSGTSAPPPSNTPAGSVPTSSAYANSPSNVASSTTVGGSGSISASSSSPFSPSSTASATSSSSSSTTPWSSLSSSNSSQSSQGDLGSMMSSSMSSSDSSSSSSSSGGQPSTSGSMASSSGMSLPSLSMTPDPSSEPDALKEFVAPTISQPDRPAKAIEVPFEIVVVCRRNDLLLHPGGWRLTTQALRDGAGKGGAIQESLLKQELRAVVRRRAQIDPLIRPRPSIKFLVEADGGTTFWIARRQLEFSGLDWPMSLQVAGPQSRRVFNKVTWDAVNRQQ
jgi:hypothetical protein